MYPYHRLAETIYTDYYHQLLKEGLYLASWWASRPAKGRQHTSVMLELRTQSSPERAIRVQVFAPAFSRTDVQVQGMVGKTIASIDHAVPKRTRGNDYFMAEGITFSTGSRIHANLTQPGNHLGQAPEKLEAVPRIPLKDLVEEGGAYEPNPVAFSQPWVVMSRTDQWATLLGTHAEGGSAIMLLDRTLDHLWVEGQNRFISDQGLVEAIINGTVRLEVDKKAEHLAWVTPKA